MIAATLLLALAGDAKVTLQAPTLHVAGKPYEVTLLLEAGSEPSTVAGWRLTRAGFTLNGEPLAEKGQEPAVELAPGARSTTTLDLSAALPAEGEFKLAWGTLERTVKVLEPAPAGLDFESEESVPTEALTKYWALLRTNRGDILAAFWPDVAPNHVRNFLDLCYTGFYDGLTFHRVIPGFMIQGGDPDGNGTGGGPRRLKAEFSDRKHVRGVLSMARSQDPDSASSQFFVMHQTSPHLDGAYSAFGKVVSGMDAVDRIVNTPRGRADRPNEPQVIEHAYVVLAPADPAAFKQGN